MLQIPYGLAEAADERRDVFPGFEGAQECDIGLFTQPQVLARRLHLDVRRHSEPRPVDTERDHRHPASVGVRMAHELVSGCLTVHHALGGAAQGDPGPGAEEPAFGAQV